MALSYRWLSFAEEERFTGLFMYQVGVKSKLRGFDNTPILPYSFGLLGLECKVLVTR